MDDWGLFLAITFTTSHVGKYIESTASRSRPQEPKDDSTWFETNGGVLYLTIMRPRILRGYFTRDGHLDGSVETTIQEVESLAEHEVLIEMFPGLAALLNRQKGNYTFILVCPHALSTDGVHELVKRWDTVVVDGKAMSEESNTLHHHLGDLGLFMIC